jgi:hypothetical protein
MVSSGNDIKIRLDQSNASWLTEINRFTVILGLEVYELNRFREKTDLWTEVLNKLVQPEFNMFSFENMNFSVLLHRIVSSAIYLIPTLVFPDKHLANGD